jgi:hypothetical protein
MEINTGSRWRVDDLQKAERLKSETSVKNKN